MRKLLLAPLVLCLLVCIKLHLSLVALGEQMATSRAELTRTIDESQKRRLEAIDRLAKAVDERNQLLARMKELEATE